MARPTKQGMDYLPLDTPFDNKTELFIVENGPVSLSVLVTLWQLIYQHEGYFIRYSDDLFFLTKMRIHLDVVEIKRCVDAAVARGLFCKTMFSKYQILTSRIIQKRYLHASKKRTIVFAVKNYICNGVFDDINPNVVWVDDAGNATKESKVKEKENTASDDADKVDEVKEKFYLSKKKIKLKGDVLRNFLLFWDAFSYKKGKAETADAFISVYSPEDLPRMIKGAKLEAKRRESLLKSGKTPKWAEGWLTGRRWEDEETDCEVDEWR